jgi:hypothetical protein
VPRCWFWCLGCPVWASRCSCRSSLHGWEQRACRATRRGLVCDPAASGVWSKRWPGDWPGGVWPARNGGRVRPLNSRSSNSLRRAGSVIVEAVAEEPLRARLRELTVHHAAIFVQVECVLGDSGEHYRRLALRVEGERFWRGVVGQIQSQCRPSAECLRIDAGAPPAELAEHVLAFVLCQFMASRCCPGDGVAPGGATRSGSTPGLARTAHLAAPASDIDDPITMVSEHDLETRESHIRDFSNH